jgi:hypothetical protein
LDDLCKEALGLIQQLTLHHVSVKKCRSCQKKLQNKLPEKGFSTYSPLIWALQPHTDSYPAWYSAGIAGLNIVDLKM